MKVYIQQRLNAARTEQEKRESDAALHFTLTDFAQMVQAYGANEVLSNMDEVTFWHLYRWFKENFEFDFIRRS